MFQVEDRTINHHGSPVSVGDKDKKKIQVMMPQGNIVEALPGHRELVARDERAELQARKGNYKQIKEENKKSSKRQTKLNTCKFIGQKVVPIVIFTFTVAYWYFGITSR